MKLTLSLKAASKSFNMAHSSLRGRTDLSIYVSCCPYMGYPITNNYGSYSDEECMILNDLEAAFDECKFISLS